MKDFLVKALLQPFLAILFFLAFGIPFVYAGFQTAQVEGHKDVQGAVVIDFQRQHFFGLWQVNEHIEKVKEAAIKTSRTHRSGDRLQTIFVSGVFLETETEAVQLFAGSSNVNENEKQEAVESLNNFIHDPAQKNFSKRFSITNIFGWAGLPFLAIGIMGLIGWPGSIIKYLKTGKVPS